MVVPRLVRRNFGILYSLVAGFEFYELFIVGAVILDADNCGIDIFNHTGMPSATICVLESRIS